MRYKTIYFNNYFLFAVLFVNAVWAIHRTSWWWSSYHPWWWWRRRWPGHIGKRIVIREILLLSRHHSLFCKKGSKYCNLPLTFKNLSTYSTSGYLWLVE